MNFILKIHDYHIFNNYFETNLSFAPELMKTKGLDLGIRWHFSSLLESRPECLDLRSDLLGSLKGQFPL